MYIKLKLISLIFILSVSNFFYGQTGWTRNCPSESKVQIEGVESKYMIYEFRFCQDKTNFYISFRKNISTDKNTKYRTIDSLIVPKKNFRSDYYFTDTGEYKVNKKLYQSLPAIVKKTKTYQGRFYKIIYKAWYFDIEKEKIVEIKLPDHNFKAYDESHN